MLDYLRSVAGEVTHGRDGGRARSADCSLLRRHRLAEAAPAGREEADQPGLLDQFQGFGGTMENIPVDVWVDADSLLRRMTMTFSMSAGSQDAGGSLRLELFDYGEPVSVEAPAASDVVDALSLKS